MFFFRQKTAYEMRISDWSSDVCSSDLFDIENVDAGEFLEQATLAHHDGFGCQRADIPQTQYRCSVGDDSYKIGARGVHGGRIFAIFMDTHARERDAGRVRQR